MEVLKDKKPLFTVLIVVVIGAALFLVYHFFFAGRSSSNALLGDGLTSEDPNFQTGIEGEVAGIDGADFADLEVNDFSSPTMDSQELIVLLNQLQGIELESAPLETPMFQGLSDNSVDIPEQSPGRANPFAPISGF